MLWVAVALALLAPAGASAATGTWESAWGQDVDAATDFGGFEICVLAADCQRGASGGSAPGAVNVPQGLGTDSAGNVYLAGFAGFSDGARITKYDANGNYVTHWSGSGTTGGKFPDFPGGVAVGPNDHVYVTDPAGNRVQEFDSSGGFVRTWGWGVNGGSGFEVCTVAASCHVDNSGHGEGGGFRDPIGIGADDDGHVFVAENVNRRVSRFTVTAGGVTWDRSWGANVDNVAPGTGFEACTVSANCQAGVVGSGKGGETGQSVGAAVSPAGNVYIIESENHRIEEFTPDGTFVTAWGEGVNNGATGVCNTAANCQNGDIGSGDGEFAFNSSGTYLSISSAGDVEVPDWGNARIQVFDTAGTFKRAYGSSGTLGGEFDRPTATATGAGQAVYVNDGSDNSRIQKFRDSSAAAATFAFSSATYSHAEQAGSATITVQRGGDVSAPVNIHYATANGTATAPADYTATSGTFNFAVGEATKTFNVVILDDEENEGDQTINLTLSIPSFGDSLGAPSAAVLTILDDDALNTRVTSGPNGPTKDNTPTFGFEALPPTGATFECSMDTAASANFSACPSPKTYAVLPDGAHTFRVRAKTSSLTDPTPASSDFFVDTQPPTTTISFFSVPGQGQDLGGGIFAGVVEIDRDLNDPAPSSNAGGEIRCVLDPTTPPANFDAMAVGCPLTVSAVGSHTVYAASRDGADNKGPVVSGSFTILSKPTVTITGGPDGFTWFSAPQFTFTSDTQGAIFRCRLDSDAFAPCNSPWLAPHRASGGHTFEVQATSPTGATSESARRSYVIEEPVTQHYDCEIKPYIAIYRSGEYACMISTVRPSAPRGDFCNVSSNRCEPITDECTLGAQCALTTKGTWRNQDKTGAGGVVSRAAMRMYPAPVGTKPYLDQEVRCPPTPGGKPCSSTASVTGFGENSDIAFECYGPDRIGGLSADDLGPDDLRSISCDGTVKIVPAEALAVLAQRKKLSINAPGGGTLLIAPARRSLKAASGTDSPPFKAATLSPSGPGPISFKPKLSKPSRKALAKKHKLTLQLGITYTPDGGDATTTTSKVTLTSDKSRKRR
jgi:hypothetical protein